MVMAWPRTTSKLVWESDRVLTPFSYAFDATKGKMVPEGEQRPRAKESIRISNCESKAELLLGPCTKKAQQHVGLHDVANHGDVVAQAKPLNA